MQAGPAASDLQLLGQLGGPTQAVAVQGGYAYVGVGYRLIVLDISGSGEPQTVGESDLFPERVEDVAVAGSHAYVAIGEQGLRVVDVSSQGSPKEVGAFTLAHAYDVTVVGAHAYVAADGGGSKSWMCLHQPTPCRWAPATHPDLPKAWMSQGTMPISPMA
jgi:hypothetical protein